jgi:hypothetical protein
MHSGFKRTDEKLKDFLEIKKYLTRLNAGGD